MRRASTCYSKNLGPGLTPPGNMAPGSFPKPPGEQWETLAVREKAQVTRSISAASAEPKKEPEGLMTLPFRAFALLQCTPHFHQCTPNCQHHTFFPSPPKWPEWTSSLSTTSQAPARYDLGAPGTGGLRPLLPPALALARSARGTPPRPDGGVAHLRGRSKRRPTVFGHGRSASPGGRDPCPGSFLKSPVPEAASQLFAWGECSSRRNRGWLRVRLKKRSLIWFDGI